MKVTQRSGGENRHSGVWRASSVFMDVITRREIIAGGAGLAGAAMLQAQGGAQPPTELRGTVSQGRVNLPPLHNPSDREGMPPNPEPAAKKLGIAVVGLGNLSLTEILPAFGQTKHVKVTALVSGERNKAEVIAAQYGVEQKSLYDYKDFDRVKDDPAVDIVYIVLPNSMHAEYTVRAAKAGKHVLCEKPMATSVKDAELMVAECKRAGKKLMIAYRCQYNEAHRSVIKMAREKQFGDVRFINAVNGQNDAPNGQWRQIKSLAGGGSLPDVGIYCFNAFRYITGEEPVEVTGQITRPKNDVRFREIEDVSTFTLRFPSGVIATGSAGYSFHENRHLRIMASEAWFGLDPAFSYEGLALQIGRRSGEANSMEERRFAPKNQFAVEMDHFADRIRSGKEARTPGSEGVQDQKILEMIYQAAAGGGVVKMPVVSGIDTTRGPEIEAAD